jgi:homoserine trans-succinylase
MTGDMIRLVLLPNMASTLMLVGLIWFVQVVHYPQLARVGAWATWSVTLSPLVCWGAWLTLGS